MSHVTSNGKQASKRGGRLRVFASLEKGGKRARLVSLVRVPSHSNRPPQTSNSLSMSLVTSKQSRHACASPPPPQTTCMGDARVLAAEDDLSPVADQSRPAGINRLRETPTNTSCRTRHTLMHARKVSSLRWGEDTKNYVDSSILTNSVGLECTGWLPHPLENPSCNRKSEKPG